MITDNADNFPTSNWLVTIIVPAESEPNEEWGFRLPRTQSAPQEGCSPFLDRQLSSPHLSPGGPAPPPKYLTINMVQVSTSLHRGHGPLYDVGGSGSPL